MVLLVPVKTQLARSLVLEKFDVLLSLSSFSARLFPVLDLCCAVVVVGLDGMSLLSKNDVVQQCAALCVIHKNCIRKECYAKARVVDFF